jgi:hypothetical protein
LASIFKVGPCRGRREEEEKRSLEAFSCCCPNAEVAESMDESILRVI